MLLTDISQADIFDDDSTPTNAGGTVPDDPKADSAELVLLSLLSERPLYGYAISKEAAARSDGKLRLTPGVLYPLLKSLEAQSLILSTWETVKSERASDG